MTKLIKTLINMTYLRKVSAATAASAADEDDPENDLLIEDPLNGVEIVEASLSPTTPSPPTSPSK